MRKIFQYVFLSVSALSFITWVAVGYMGFLWLTIIWGVMFTLTLIGEPKSYDTETFVCIRYGDEFFLEDVNQVIRPSTREEVSRLFNQKRITKFK